MTLRARNLEEWVVETSPDDQRKCNAETVFNGLINR
jgi:hypothetical protein